MSVCLYRNSSVLCRYVYLWQDETQHPLDIVKIFLWSLSKYNYTVKRGRNYQRRVQWI